MSAQFETYSMVRARVALVGPDPNRTPGGMATVLDSILQSTVLSSAGFDTELVTSHVEDSPAKKIVTGLRAAVELTTRRFALAHVHMASGWSVERKAALVGIARARRIPVILHLHGADLVEDLGANARRRSVFVATVRRCSSTIVLSEYWKYWLSELVPTADVHVIKNSVDLPSSVVGLAQRPTVLFLGRLGTRKGVWTLIQAAQRVAERVPGARIVLAGDGELAEVRAAVDRLGLSRIVTVLGWVPRVDTPRLIDEAWVLCLPSFAEGLPMALLEAMGRGRPVVTTPVGGIPDMVTSGVEGFLHQPGDTPTLADHLIRILSDRDLCVSMGAAARARVAAECDNLRNHQHLTTLYAETVARGQRSCA